MPSLLDRPLVLQARLKARYQDHGRYRAGWAGRQLTLGWQWNAR